MLEQELHARPYTTLVQRWTAPGDMILVYLDGFAEPISFPCPFLETAGDGWHTILKAMHCLVNETGRLYPADQSNEDPLQPIDLEGLLTAGNFHFRPTGMQLRSAEVRLPIEIVELTLSTLPPQSPMRSHGGRVQPGIPCSYQQKL